MSTPEITTTPARPSVKPLPREWLQKLSTRLADAFEVQERQSSDFYSPEILEWKYFVPRDQKPGPFSLVVADGDKMLSHIGILLTDFHSTESGFQPVPMVHTIDWFSSPNAGPAGSLLYVSAIRRGAAQYAMGCSEPARRVLLGFRFQEIGKMPLFHAVFRPANPAVWRELHGKPSFFRSAALKAVDNIQNLRPLRTGGPLTIRRIEKFGDEINEVIRRTTPKFLFTSRESTLLNHFLAHPHKVFSGWHFYEGDKLRGFCLLACFDKADLRMGKIADCFLDNDDPALWAQAFSLAAVELRRQGAELATAFGSVPWTIAGLKKAGFFRRGRIPFYLRDPDKRLPTNLPFFLTLLEGDNSYL